MCVIMTSISDGFTAAEAEEPATADTDDTMSLDPAMWQEAPPAQPVNLSYHQEEFRRLYGKVI